MFLIHDVFTDLWRCDNELYNGIRYFLGIGVLPRSRMGLLVRGANCMPCHHYHGFIGVFQDSVPHMDGWHCIAFISFLSWPCCCPRLCGWVAVTKKGFCLYGNFCFQRLSGFVTVCLFKNNPQYECSKFVETISKTGGKANEKFKRLFFCLGSRLDIKEY